MKFSHSDITISLLDKHVIFTNSSEIVSLDFTREYFNHNDMLNFCLDITSNGWNVVPENYGQVITNKLHKKLLGVNKSKKKIKLVLEEICSIIHTRFGKQFTESNINKDDGNIDSILAIVATYLILML